MIYIVGLGRSGSTLLTAILNNHSEIKAVPEIPLVLFFANDYQNIKGKSKDLELKTKSYLELIQHIRPKSIIDLNLDHLENLEYSNYIEFCEEVFSKFKILKSFGKKNLYVDKNPQYTFYIQKLAALDPNAKFIFLVRDYRDNVLSRMTKPNNKTIHPAYNAFRNRFYLKELVRKENTKNSILLRYEDFVESPHNEIERICNFFNISYEEEMFDFDPSQFQNLEVKKTQMNDFINKHFANLGKTITNEAVGKWKTKLSFKEIILIESICDKYGKSFNYQSTSKKISYWWVVFCYFPHFVVAKWHIIKDKIIFFAPSSLKLRRLHNIYRKF